LILKQVEGEISYNGYKLNEFVPRKTSAYISQNDVHLGEMTVKETMDFSARCQGVGTRYGIKFHQQNSFGIMFNFIVLGHIKSSKFQK